MFGEKIVMEFECISQYCQECITYLTTSVVGWFYFCLGFSVSERGKGSGRAEYLG